MFKKAGLDTDQIARSLLQKAIRRNDISMTRAAIDLIIQQGDFDWLRNRLAVITFEECWAYASEVSFEKDESVISDHLVKLATTVKNKDAAGLGSLGYELSRGDISVLNNSSEDRNIKLIAEAIRRPKDFWSWILGKAKEDEGKREEFVSKTYEGFKRAGWPWDRAFAQAAALLATTSEVPMVKYSSYRSHEEFPFWVSIDKHTKEGRSAIRQSAMEIGLNATTALWIAFYIESAKCQEIETSLWWSKEIQWRMRKLGLSFEVAVSTWERLKPRVLELLGPEIERNRNRIHACGEAIAPPVQGRIFELCPQSTELE